MATLTVDDRSDKTTGYAVQWYEGKRRRSIYLGGRKYSRKTAKHIKEMIETLIWYKHNGTLVPAKMVANWLQSISDDLRNKLAKAGLITVHAPKTCKQLWDSFIKYKKDVKPSTIKTYLVTQVLFLRHLRQQNPVKRLHRIDYWNGKRHCLLNMQRQLLLVT